MLFFVISHAIQKGIISFLITATFQRQNELFKQTKLINYTNVLYAIEGFSIDMIAITISNIINYRWNLQVSSTIKINVSTALGYDPFLPASPILCK